MTDIIYGIIIGVITSILVIGIHEYINTKKDI